MAVGCAAVLALVLSPARSARAEAKARLVYARGPGTGSCPLEIELRLLVVARLGYDPFSPQASRVVLARIEKHGARLVGVVELVNQDGVSSGRRELAASRRHCDELSRAMALSISLTVDPERVIAKRGATAAGGSGAFGSSAPEPAAELSSPEPAARRADELRLYGGVTVAGAARLLPSFAMGGGGYLGLGFRSFSLQLEARIMQSFQSDLSPNGSLSGETIDPGLTACRAFERLGLCLVTQLGIERVRATGPFRPRTISALHAAAGPRFLVYFPQDARLTLVAGLEGLFNLSLNHARMSGKEIWNSPLLSGTIVIGAETDFL
jgi:hypothetical protein